MAEKDKKPEIRFTGFTDAWEQCKLGEIADRVQGNDGRMDLPTLTISAANGWLDQRDRFYGNIAGNEQKNYTLLSKGELSYNHGNSKLAKYGAVFELKNYEEALVPRVYHSFRVNEDAVASFVEYLFSTKLPDKELGKLISSGARMDGLLNISYDDFMGIAVNTPQKAEQAKIGAFFRKLDHLITLHQREYNKLVIVKKSMLEKMFPKDGANVPEIRFAGFTDAWEQRKLGDVADRIVRKNTNLESTLPLTISAQYGLVDQITYFNNRIASRDVSNYYLVKKGEFAYNKSYSEGYPFGAVKRLDLYEMGVLSTLYIVFAPKIDVINSDYLVSYYETNNWHKQVAERAAEGARNHGLLNISADAFFDTELKYPKNKTEQAKIGVFFKQQDNLITLHLRKLEKLKNIKKSMFEKMFV
ncbi:restriction endonuclease subunit S [Priestia megaterium]|nr:restriction endonuclease subunit S [Priestia megaterium]